MPERVAGDQDTHSFVVSVPARIHADGGMVAFRICTVVLRELHLPQQPGGFFDSRPSLLCLRLCFTRPVLGHGGLSLLLRLPSQVYRTSTLRQLHTFATIRGLGVL